MMTLDKIPQIKHLPIGNFFLMAGPCVIENHETPYAIVEHIIEITNRLGIPYIFKASYRKANRSRMEIGRASCRERV